MCFFLRHGGDDPGPAGRMLVAWRALDRSAPLSAPLAGDAAFHVAETLQLEVDDGLRAAIADAQRLAASTQTAPFAAAQAARIVAQQPGAGFLALWLADAVLAARPKWPRPLPLIAGALVHPSLRSGGIGPIRAIPTGRAAAASPMAAPRSRPAISLPNLGAARKSSSRSLPVCGRGGRAPSSKPSSTKMPCRRRRAASWSYRLICRLCPISY
jgi:hypothetical protein